MSEASKDIEAAAAQSPNSNKDGPDLVPTGDYIGNPEGEVGRIMQLMSGSIPKDEQHQGPVSTPDQQEPNIPAEIETPVDPQDPQGPTIQDLIEEQRHTDDPSTMRTDPSEQTDESRTIKIGDREVPITTVADWEDSYRNSEGMLKTHQQKEQELNQDREMWRRSLEALRNDPVQGLTAIGLSPQDLVNKVKQAGLLASAPEALSEHEYSDIELDDDAPVALKRLVSQNAKLASQIQQANARHEELMQRLDMDARSKQEQEIADWHNGRVSSAQKYLEGIVNRSTDLDGQAKGLLLKATLADVENGIDSAPLDEPGLREWAKGRLRDVLGQSSPEDVAKAIKNPKKSNVPARVGETPRAENDASWDKVDHFVDDDRKKGALAWMEYHSRNQ